MERQNVTISLPAEVVREARHLAVDKGLSLSKFLGLLLEEHIEAKKRYDASHEEIRKQYNAAREQELRALKEGLPLGTHGKISWTRDELHER